MLKKKFFKAKPTCQVTFQLPEGVEATKVSVAGDFNNWDESANPMKKVKGIWKTTVELDKEQEYQFRYLLDRQRWVSDEDADDHAATPFVDARNSVVRT